MFTGCLPALLQVPFFTVVYRLFLSGTVGGSPNLLLRQHLFSASLGSHWLTGAGPLSGQGLVFGAVFALLILVAVALHQGGAALGRAGARPAAGARPQRARSGSCCGSCRSRRWPSPRWCRSPPASTC